MDTTMMDTGADGADLGMTDAEIAATIRLVGVVFDERETFGEILDQLLVGEEQAAGVDDAGLAGYFEDLAQSLERLLDAIDGIAAGRVAAEALPPVG
jgi:hypothetical protein